MSVQTGVQTGFYALRFLPNHVRLPIFGGGYATAVDPDKPVILVARGPEWFTRQKWAITSVPNMSGIYTIALDNRSLPSTLYLSTGKVAQNETVILSETAQRWYISRAPGEGYVISAITPVIGASFCIGVTDHEELVLKSFAVVPSVLHTRPRWDLQFEGIQLNPGPVFLLPSLSDWVGSKIFEMYQATTSGEMEDVIKSFIRKDAKITVNGAAVSREEYTKGMIAQMLFEASAKSSILDTVEVPDNLEKPKESGCVGVIYHAYIASKELILGVPEEFYATSSLDVVIKWDPSIAITDQDHRRVYEMTQVISTKPVNNDVKGN